MDSRVLVMDNGASSIKIGFAHKGISYKDPVMGGDTSLNQFKILPNFIAKSKSERRRPFISSQIEDCRDSSGLFLILPFQKGYMCCPDTEKTIWDFAFSPNCQNIVPSETNLIFTEPVLNFPTVQDINCEMLFEGFGFKSVCRATGPQMVDYYHGKYGSAKDTSCTIIAESGHSFTHIVPYVHGRKVVEGIRRIDVGGKALTNHLKEIISYRQLHVLDEFYLMNQAKEDLCYVSSNFNADMELARKRLPENTIIREYVLPNYVTVHRGYVRKQEEVGVRLTSDDQILRLNTERFTVPELIFNPSDIGIKQMGISEAIIACIMEFPESMHSHFFQNILLCGGNVRFPGFRERVYEDVRSSTSYYYDINVIAYPEPETLAWRGACEFSNDPEFKRFSVTKQEYSEMGMLAYNHRTDI